MEVQFRCNLADYREALHFQLKRSVGYYLLVVLGSMNVLVGTFLAYKADFRVGLIMQLLGIFWLAGPVVIRPLWVRRDFRKHPNSSVAQGINVNDEGLHSTSDNCGGNRKMVCIHQVSRDAKSLHATHGRQDVSRCSQASIIGFAAG